MRGPLVPWPTGTWAPPSAHVEAAQCFCMWALMSAWMSFGYLRLIRVEGKSGL